MDVNDLPQGFGTTSWPMGMGAANLLTGQQPYPAALSPEGTRETDSLTEAEKERIILECKDAQSPDEVEKIIEEKVPGGEISKLVDGMF